MNKRAKGVSEWKGQDIPSGILRTPSLPAERLEDGEGFGYRPALLSQVVGKDTMNEVATVTADTLTRFEMWTLALQAGNLLLGVGQIALIAWGISMMSTANKSIADSMNAHTKTLNAHTDALRRLLERDD